MLPMSEQAPCPSITQGIKDAMISMAEEEKEGSERLCINCYYRKKSYKDDDGLWSVCTHPNAGYISHVNGKTRYPLCSSERFVSGDCGPCGKNYESGGRSPKNECSGIWTKLANIIKSILHH